MRQLLASALICVGVSLESSGQNGSVRHVAQVSDWLEGARVRTLPAGLAPVIAGAALAWQMGGFHLVYVLLAVIVSLAFQVGSNFANDYSDGIRGTDEFRSGPPRLTAGGKASPRTVKMAAYVSFAVALLAGLGLVILAQAWIFIAFGLAAILAAWFYTGGRHPYGYMGLGEIAVFTFFGLMATCGTVYVQTRSLPWQVWVIAASLGLIACAILMINNVRDIPTDAQSGKITLAVRLGDTRARWAYVALLLVPFLGAVVVYRGLLLLTFLPAATLATMQCQNVLGRGRTPATGKALIAVLRNTGFVELLYGLAVLASAAIFQLL